MEDDSGSDSHTPTPTDIVSNMEDERDLTSVVLLMQKLVNSPLESNRPGYSNPVQV